MKTLTRHVLSAVLLMAGAAQGATAQLEAVHAVGGRQSVWLVLSDAPSPPSEEPTHRLLYRAVTASKFRRYRSGQRITGEIRAAAVLDRDLHLFFAGGAHRCYSPDGDEPRVALPDRTPPKVVSADEPAGALWAIASPTTTTDQAASFPPGAIPSPKDILLCHQLNTWSTATPIPQIAQPADQRWLCAADGAVQLFWSGDAQGDRVAYASWQEGVWSPPETTQLLAQQMLTAFSVNQQLVAAFGGPPDLPSRRAAVHFARRTPDRWTQHTVNLSGDTLSDDESGPTGLTVAPLGQNVLIATWSPDGAVAAGLAGLTDASVELADVPAARPVEPPPSVVGPTPPWMVAALMAGIMLVLFWRRQSALLRPAALPGHLTCAALWKRALAFAIDSLPAAAVTAPLWHAMQGKVFAAVPLDQADPATHAALLQAVWLAWAGFRCVQGAYCGLSEAVMGTSPGKRLLGCRVVTEGGDRLSVGQAVLRNLFRIIELEIEPPLLPLVLLVGLTRNRQRLGDIVARTVVVEVRAGEPAAGRPDAGSHDDSR